MSLAAIQDNLVKTSLVQQTQTRSDDVGRGQEIARVAVQREHDRQGDQVVISSQQKEEHGIRPDAEREKGDGQRRRKRNGASGESDDDDRREEKAAADSGGREAMRRINIVV